MATITGAATRAIQNPAGEWEKNAGNRISEKSADHIEGPVGNIGNPQNPEHKA